jgi:PAS domain S-box-containing protein
MKILSLKQFLSRLIWLCVLPLVLLAVFLALIYVQTLKTQQDDDARDQAHNMAAALDRQLQGHISGLQMLAASPLLDSPPRFKEFYREAGNFCESFGGHVVLADSSTQMIINTRSPFGAVLPKLPVPKGHSAVAQVLATGKPAVGDSFLGPIARETLVAVVVPVFRNQELKYFLVNTFATRLFKTNLEAMPLSPGWSMTLLDGREAVMAQRGAVNSGTSPVGENPFKRYRARSTMAYWSVVIDVPPHIYRRPILVAVLALGVTIFFCTLISFLGGKLAGRKLSQSVSTLAKKGIFREKVTVIAEVEAVRRLLNETATARKTAELERRKSEEKYRLLAEYATDVIWILDLDSGYFRYVSPSVEQLRGFTAEAVMAQDFSEALTRDSLETLQSILPGRLAKFREGQIEFYTDEIDQPHRNGSIVRTEVTSRYLMNQSTGHLEVVGVSRDIGKRKTAEEALRHSLEEKVVLLKEIHHRVKNNLQIVASLLNLQAGRTANQELKAMLQDTRNRVRSMALLHEVLYRSDNLAYINFQAYVKELIAQLLRSFGPAASRIKVEILVAPVGLPLDQAVPLGLMINELISNALKHGFPEDRRGTVVVSLNPVEDRTVVMQICDDGIGLSRDFDPARTDTLGLTLVSNLARQLQGHLSIEQPSAGGTGFTVVFPLSKDPQA